MRLYVIQIGTAKPRDYGRWIKIGYYDKHPDGNETKYFLAANKENNYEVSATEVSKSFCICIDRCIDYYYLKFSLAVVIQHIWSCLYHKSLSYDINCCEYTGIGQHIFEDIY